MSAIQYSLPFSQTHHSRKRSPKAGPHTRVRTKAWLTHVRFASASLPYLRQEPGRWPHATETQENPGSPVPVQLRFEVPAHIALPGEGCRRHRCDLRPLDFRGTAEEAQSRLLACILWDSRLAPVL